MHFRGPLQLKQFAVYTPGQASDKKKARRSEHARRHAHHAHGHAHEKKDVEERQVGDMVYLTTDGTVWSWTNEYSGVSTSAAASSAASTAATTTAAAAAADTAAASVGSSPSSVASAASSSAASSASAAAESGSIASSSGSWGRQAYYDSSAGTADGLVFLNHYGGAGTETSGVWDAAFGNSLSYADSTGCTASSSSQVLADTTLPSNEEVVIMSDSECGDDGCGYVRNGTVAYHGFDGASKAFFMEFSMPSDGQTATTTYDNINMPAIWMLNAQIPRTLQYGQADCSCWTSGCGEFDIFEVLYPAYEKATSCLHGNIAGGDSAYFVRPESGTIKLAVVLYENNVHMQILDDSTDFGSDMSADTISNICESTSTASDDVSLFALAG